MKFPTKINVHFRVAYSSRNGSMKMFDIRHTWSMEHGAWHIAQRQFSLMLRWLTFCSLCTTAMLTQTSDREETISFPAMSCNFLPLPSYHHECTQTHRLSIFYHQFVGFLSIFVLNLCRTTCSTPMRRKT